MRSSLPQISNQPDWSFQDDAVRAVVKDFVKDLKGKKLLVIPTGGGKTVVALKVVSELIRQGVLSNTKKAIWVVHTKWLKKQAQLKLEDSLSSFGLVDDLSSVLKICMKAEARDILQSQESNLYSMIIIDEAHHSAAISYKEFFNPEIGVLGLTATPTRTDDLELDFSEISYSITFRELVNRNVILLPTFEEVVTHISIDAGSLDYYAPANDMEKFDLEARNELIAEEILKRRAKFKKVVVFVGSNAHVKSLYAKIDQKNKFYNRPFQHVGYIFGGDNNELGLPNNEYLDQHRLRESSVLVNCLILNEGYDDPKLNAVIMATPSRSVLYYMQCVGRVVRNPGDDISGKAYVLELVDRLPNIKYRIDNRWLFAEISDYLEPQVIDIKYEDEVDLRGITAKILQEHGVEAQYLDLLPLTIKGDNFGMLLFADAPERPGATWKPIYFEPGSAEKYIRMFNKLSTNIGEYAREMVNDEFAFFSVCQIPQDDRLFSDRKMRVSLLLAMERAYEHKCKHRNVDCLKYFTFTKSVRYPWWVRLWNWITNIINFRKGRI